MSGDPRRLTTEEERERLHAARNNGGRCAACGKVLGPDEPVYWEHFVVGKVGGIIQHPKAPVGAECAPPWFLEEMEQEQPEPCAGCGRPVYYAVTRAGRTRAACSRRCQLRASVAGRKRRSDR
jgi:hypothetical protein